MSSTASPVYGVREFDLSADRSQEGDYKLIQLPRARFISLISVPDECYLRFGSRTSPRLDLRDYSELESEEGAFGTAYLENPAGSGTLRMLIGVTFTTETGDAVSISSINDSVDVSDRAGRALGTVDVTDPVDVSSDAARSVGKARLMDSTETLIDPLDAGDMGPFHDRVTAASTYATINPGAYGDEATIVADTSGAATLTVEVSNDGASWSSYDIDIADASGHKENVSGFGHVRCQLDSSVNSLEISAKGV